MQDQYYTCWRGWALYEWIECMLNWACTCGINKVHIESIKFKSKRLHSGQIKSIPLELTDYKLNQSNTGWIEQRDRLGQTRTSYTGGIDRIQLDSTVTQYSLNKTKSGITGHAQVEPMINYRLNKTKTGFNDHMQTKLIICRHAQSNTA